MNKLMRRLVIFSGLIILPIFIIACANKITNNIDDVSDESLKNNQNNNQNTNTQDSNITTDPNNIFNEDNNIQPPSLPE